MSVAEHMALDRRVSKLERAILAVEPKRIRTRFRVYRRGPEPPCRDAADARRLATLDPVVELVGEYPDLDVLIDAKTGARIFRLEGDDPVFDELAEGVDVIDVPIDCYVEQLVQIRSDRAITATTGGTRAGKTRVLVWWLFRQWLIRGHGVDEDHEIEAVFWWVREDSGKLYKHAVLWLTRLWPDVFVGKRPTESTKNPSLHLFDGSRIDFKHAANSGSKAGTSLRSESVEALVVDELSAIHAEENWREMKSRVAQTGGPIATAFTPTAGHWSAQLAKQASNSGGTISVRRLTMFDNPWWPFARMWVDLLKDAAITETELREKILAKPDPVSAALEVVTDPHVRRMRFGEEQALGLTLWRKWDAKRFTVRDHRYERDQLEVDGRRLNLITSAVAGREFGSRGRAIRIWGGKDFNVNPGVTLVGQAFGSHRAPVVLIFDEIASKGPTLVNAEAVAERYPGLCMFCDPTGDMGAYRHESHGPKGSTDAEELRRAGFGCEPANGTSKDSARHLSQIDSINVVHRAMHRGLLYVHARCPGLLNALDEMQSTPDGRIAKVSGRDSLSDQISAYGDAMRYMLWPVYRDLLGHGSVFVGEKAA
jgi:hypothetical protein